MKEIEIETVQRTEVEPVMLQRRLEALKIDHDQMRAQVRQAHEVALSKTAELEGATRQLVQPRERCLGIIARATSYTAALGLPFLKRSPDRALGQCRTEIRKVEREMAEVRGELRKARQGRSVKAVVPVQRRCQSRRDGGVHQWRGAFSGRGGYPMSLAMVDPETLERSPASSGYRCWCEMYAIRLGEELLLLPGLETRIISTPHLCPIVAPDGYFGCSNLKVERMATGVRIVEGEEFFYPPTGF